MGTDPNFQEDRTMKTVAAALLFALLGGGCAATGGKETPFVASWAAHPRRFAGNPLTELAVTWGPPTPTALEPSTFLQGPSFVSAAGNHASAVEPPSASPVAGWPFVPAINVSSSGGGAAIVALAD